MRLTSKTTPECLGMTFQKIRARPKDVFDDVVQNTGSLAVFRNGVKQSNIPPLRIVLGRNHNLGRTYEYVVFVPEQDRVTTTVRMDIHRVSGPSLRRPEVASWRRKVISRFEETMRFMEGAEVVT